MPNTNLERNTFVAGLITEASPLAFPENASIDEDNFVLNREGSRERRKGMDYEFGHAMLDTGMALSAFESTAVTGFKWDNANNDPALVIGVIQIGYRIWFVDGYDDALSASVLGLMVITSIEAKNVTQFAVINGKLIAVNAAFDHPKTISYDGATFTEADIDLKVRDIWGVADGLGVGERPAPGSLDFLHEYNLFNQGWPKEGVRLTEGGTNFPHLVTGASRSFYPSNSEVWFAAKDAEDKFDWQRLSSAAPGSREAPRGRVILDAFNRGASRKSFMNSVPNAAKVATQGSVSDIPDDSEQSTVTTVAAYAGRIFYSGIDSEVLGADDNTPIFSSTIMFTQVIRRDSDLGACYSVNDVTTEDFNALLATDGGTILIPDASRILRLISKDGSLVVIAENGVWEITGPDGIFRADDFSIRQITNVGAVGADSVVVAEGSVFYWSKSGIYVLAADPTVGRMVAQNMTEVTIQTQFTSIPSVGKANAVARYDSDARRVSWLYNDSDGYDGVTQKNKYNRELILDTVLQAFSTVTFSETATDSPYVAGYLPTGDFNVITDVQNVEVNGVQAQVNGVDVVVSRDVRSRGASSTKYVAVKPNSTGTVEFTFSIYDNVDFRDWEEDDGVGVDAPAYLVTGYELFGDTMRRKQAVYLVMHFGLTENEFELIGDDLEAVNPSSCLVQSQWGYGVLSSQFQAYKLPRNFTPTSAGPFDYGQNVITSKNKLRGAGRAFSMRVETEAGKDLYLYGWGLSVDGSRDV